MKAKIKVFDFDVSVQSGADAFLSKAKGVAIAVDDGADLDKLTRCQSAKLVKVVTWKKEGKKVKAISNNHTNIKDAVLFTGETDMDDLKTIVNDVTKHNGKAVIVSVPLNFFPRIPVFVADENFFKKINNKQAIDRATVSFSLVEQYKNDVKLSKNHYHPLVDKPINEESKESYEFDSKEKKDSFDLVEAKSNDGYQRNFEEENHDSIKQTTEKERFSSSSDTKTLSKSGTIASFLNGARNGAKKLGQQIFGLGPKSEFSDELKEILYPGCKWLKPESDSYIKALGILSKAQKSDHVDLELKEICLQVQEYFTEQEDDVDVVVLTFAINLHSEIKRKTECYEERKKLERAIMNSFRRIDVATPGTKLCEKQPPLDAYITSEYPSNESIYPHKVVSTFIKNNLDSIISHSNISGAVAVKKRTLESIFCVLALHCEFEQESIVHLMAQYVDPQSFKELRNNHEHALCKYLEPAAFCSLALSSQRTLRDFCSVFELLMDQSDSSLELHVYSNSMGQLKWLIENKYHPKSDDLLHLQIVSALGKLLIINENTYAEKIAEDAVRSFLQKHSYRKTKTFDHFMMIWYNVDVEHIRIAIIQKHLLIILKRDFQGRSNKIPEMNDVENLLSHPLGTRLVKEGIIVEFANKMVTYAGYNLKSKFRFLDTLCRKLKMEGYEPGQIHDTFKDLIFDATLYTQRPIFESFQAAKDNSHIFLDDDHEQYFVEIVAKAIVTKGRVYQLKNDDLMELDIDIQNKKTLISCLSNTLISFLCVKYNDLDKAAKWYKDIDKSLQMRPSINKTSINLIREKVLVLTIQNWEPKVMTDVLELEQEAVGLLELVPDKVTCIKDITNSWLSSFVENTLAISEIDSTLCLFEEKKWEMIEKCLSIRLPNLKEMVEKINEFEKLYKNIGLRNLIELNKQKSKRTILSILKEYGVKLSSITQVENIILNSEKHLSDRIDPQSRQQTLKSIIVQNDLMTKFFTNYQEELIMASYFLGKKSSFFNNEIGYGSWSSLTLTEFFQKLSNTKAKLLDLLQCNGSNIFDTIKCIMQKTIDSRMDLENEFDLVQSCPTLAITPEHKEDFLQVATLVRLSGKVSGFVNCCEQMRFAFIENDGDFGELEKLSSNLSSHDITGTWTIEDIVGCNHSLQNVFYGIPQAQSDTEVRHELIELLPILDCFATLSLYSEVWTFVREMQWFGEDGQRQFNQMYENVTNVLLSDSESFAMAVLDCLEPIVRLLSFIGNLTLCTSFKDAFDQAKALPGIMDKNNVIQFKKNIKTVQQNLTSIREWFGDGVDEMSSVFSKFDRIVCTGQYHFEDYAICLRYTEIKNGTQNDTVGMKMDENDLNEFVQKLGFVKHEKHEHSEAIESFIDQSQLLQSVLEHQKSISALGFEDFNGSCFLCPANPTLSTLIQSLYQKSKQSMARCEIWLEEIHSKYPVSLLFWNEELKMVHENINSLTLAGEEEDILPLMRFILSVFSPNRSLLSTSRSKLIQIGKESIASIATEGRWLKNVSQFLQTLYDHLGASLHSLESTVIEGDKGISLYSLECDTQNKSFLTLFLITEIFKKRLPCKYEIFDAKWITSTTMLQLFLKRVGVFPTSQFMLLNTQELCSEHQELIFNFISRPERANTFNLHCIQKENTILQASPPWMKKTVLDNKEVQKRSNEMKEVVGKWLKANVLDSCTFDKIAVVSTQRCGTGKTRFILEQLRKISQEDPCTQTATISIHDKSTLKSIVTSLQRKFCNSSANKAVHFSFMVPLGSQNAELMEMLNYFFQSFFLMGCVQDPENAITFHLGVGRWNVFIEIPQEVDDSNESVKESLLFQYIPILAHCSSFESPPGEFCIDEKARRVGIYLRAYNDGTIDRKFDSRPSKKQLMFVIDRSGSMETMMGNGKNALDVAIDNALAIFNSHVQVDDVFGTILFDHEIDFRMRLRELRNTDDFDSVRHQFERCRRIGGGTSMYWALLEAINALEQNESIAESTWIVCLTDGVSDNKRYEELQRKIQQTSVNLHLILVGVNLNHNYREQMRNLCKKYETNDDQGLFVASEAEVGSLNEAFIQVASKIPVSQTFELDGALSDSDCRGFMEQHLPHDIATDDMLSRKFWIEFLYRRVKVFDQNQEFNYNETCDHLGSSLMKIMLFEGEQLLSKKQNKSWRESNHEQLIYDFTDPLSPQFRLICTAPDLMDESMKKRYMSLELPGFYIPSSADLRKREILDRFLSQALDIPLTKGNPEHLACITDNKFVLTLDFTMKLLNIHERIACHIPCIIEGETGVSKTALTKMYSILRNSALKAEAEKSTALALNLIKTQLEEKGFLTQGENDDSEQSEVLKIIEALEKASDGTLSGSTEFGRELYKLITAACDERRSIFQPIPSSFDNQKGAEGDTTTVCMMLEWFSSSLLEDTFFEINVDSSLTEKDIVEYFDQIQNIASKVLDSNALVVVFLDEVNTSSILGLFKEIVVDHSILGKRLGSNVVVVAACNPAGRNAVTHGGMARDCDLGKEWASGHYQVNELPQTMHSLKWEYGSLNSTQEKEFVFRRMEMLGHAIPQYLVYDLTELIIASHEAVRTFAEINILGGLKRNLSGQPIDESLVKARAKSSVSLREIQRVFSLFAFFTEEFPLTKGEYKESMHLTIAVVYYFRLDSASRRKFIEIFIELSSSEDISADFQNTLDDNMDKVVDELVIPQGIALTRGLKENIFMTVVCSLSSTPLMIVGPPGSSKTLSVNIVSDNANGEESPSSFYRNLPRLSTFHYQCSKTSTSKEVASVFDQAIQRQQKVDEKKHKCLVFMDEAGLPEEEKESLKVLHYYLEGHMSTKASVGFVAITNHVLDAAKSNRCVSLLRQEPDQDEMMQIARGVLFDSYGISSQNINMVRYEDTNLSKEEVSQKLCDAYATVLRYNDKELETFFGLRDFIFFLKYLRCNCHVDEMELVLSPENIVHGVERNFNGVNRKTLFSLASIFLSLFSGKMETQVSSFIRQPIDVIRDALMDSKKETGLQRYTLLIDESEDDSIVRLLHHEGLIDISKKCLFKLSRMPENARLEEINLVCGVKYAALKGAVIILSQTDTINESFYDLFNQHFRRVANKHGEEDLYANIAVGGISRRSKVSPQFHCIVHIRLTDLAELPAPFLNRFEKYRLRVSDVLGLKLDRSTFLKRLVEKSMSNVKAFAVQMKVKNLSGFSIDKTIESFYLNFISKIDPEYLVCDKDIASPKSFVDHFINFINSSLKMKMAYKEVKIITDLALKCLCLEESEYLNQLLSKFVIENPTNMISCFNQVLEGKPVMPIARITENLTEMIITREAISAILSLATPEAIFSKRTSLPSELIYDYFLQEHFSLKRLMDGIVTVGSGSKFIIHTRSDAAVLRIPTVKIGHNNNGNIDILEKLVHNQADTFVVAHLCALKNEATVRSIIDNWAESEKVHIFLFIVDMSESAATDRINFIRCCIDQIALKHEKRVVLLLHYSPAAFATSSFYPVLFLDEWQHQFLDSVGGDHLSSLDVKGLIRTVCLNKEESNVFSIDETVKSLLQSALKSVASWNIFYDDQEASHSSHQRYKALTHLFSLNLNLEKGTTIQDILCTRFASFWTKSRLGAALKQATHNIKQGNSQLPITAYLRSFLQDAMHQFLMYFLVLLNEWKNFDVLHDRNQGSNVAILFYDILTRLPSLPLEEMTLLRVGRPEMKILPASYKAQPCFPFFSQISETIDQVVESTLSKLTYEDTDVLLSSLSYEQCLNQAMALLSESSSSKETIIDNTNGVCHNMSSVVLFCVEVINKSEDEAGSLHGRYLEQYIGWKLCCDLDSVAARWFQSIVRRISRSIEGFRLNIILIHFIARKHEMDILRLNCKQACPFSNKVNEEDELSLPSQPLGEILSFDAFTKWFWDNLEYLSGPDQWTNQWLSSFSFFLNSMTESLQNKPLEDESISDRLRGMSFLYILVNNQVPDNFVYKKVQEIIQNEGNDTVSLESFIQSFDDVSNDDLKYQCIESTLQHFFSPLWLSNVHCRWEEDLKYLISVADYRDDIPGKYQLCLVLVRNACFFGSSVDEKVLGKKHMCDTTLHISFLRSNFLSSNLECEGISNFSHDGKRETLPHFIPPWIRCESVNDTRPTQTEFPNRDKVSLFFSNYHSSFAGDFANIMFDLILAELAQSVAGESSERSMLKLFKDIEIEFNLQRHDQARISRLRSHSSTYSDKISLTGSPLSILIIEARLLFFVLQVSYEFATDDTVAAFNGTYSDLAYSILNQVMSLEGVRWQEIFFLNIIRLRGKGFLIRLLKNNDMLKNFPWTSEWRTGLPTAKEELEESLRVAEEKLQEATYEEERKAREFLLCPHCRQPFAILARNCGQFVCGRADTHIDQNGHGCGQAFNMNEAQPYSVNETILDPLQQDAEQAQEKMQEYNNLSHLWKTLHEGKLPLLVSSLDIYDKHSESFLPTSFANMTVGNKSELLRHLLASRKEIKYFTMLPDLIEFYHWAHVTFKFLVTFEEATKLHIDIIMNEDTLRHRFDSFNVKHMLSLWQRLRDHLDHYLEQNNCEVQWDCETIKIPFSKTADISLIMLLSAYEHPTEGYDYLFIIINDIIGRFNYFMMKLNECKEVCIDEVQQSEISPDTIVPGSLGAASLSSLNWIASVHFNRLVERFRTPKVDEYDITNLEQAVCQKLSFCEFTIQNPMKLWRHFNFRLEYTSSTQDEVQSGHVSSEGFHFVQFHDFQLFEDCKQYLKMLGYDRSDHKIRHLLAAKFNDLNYEQLRSVLTGLKGILQQTSESDNNTFDTLDEVLFSVTVDDPGEAFEELGFFKLSDAQIKTILSLTPMQLVETIQYTGYQLASEGHLFASLPLSMNTPITPDTIKALEANVLDLADSHSHQGVMVLLQEFKTDILSFYQNPIRVECLSSNKSLRTFLEEQNFCDSSDPIFAALPLDITVRNFVPLQQKLHQLRLRFASHVSLIESNEDDDISEQNDMDYAQTRRGRSWLWSSKALHTKGLMEDTQNENDIDGESIDSQISDTGISFSSNESDTINLWFETGYREDIIQVDDNIISLSEKSEEGSHNHDCEYLSFDDLEDDSSDTIDEEQDEQHSTTSGKVDNCEDEDYCLVDNSDVEHASLKIQKWWRSCRSVTPTAILDSEQNDEEDSNYSVEDNGEEQKQDEEEEQMKDGNNKEDEVDQHPPVINDYEEKVSKPKPTVQASPRPLLPLSNLRQNLNSMVIHKMIKIAFFFVLGTLALSSLQLVERPKETFLFFKEMLDILVKIAFCIFVYKYVSS